MTETSPHTEPQPSTGFRKMVAGDCPITFMKNACRAFGMSLCLALMCNATLAQEVKARSGQTDLIQGFQSPPSSARMWADWFWVNDNVDKEHITADLEAMKARGYGGASVFGIHCAPSMERGPGYMSPEYRALFLHALKEAARLDLGIHYNLCSSWDAGGPWIDPEHGCKRLTTSELVLTGPQHFKGPLPPPPADKRLYRDVAVQAFRTKSTTPAPVITASSSGAIPIDPGRNEYLSCPAVNAFDGDAVTFWLSDGRQNKERLTPDHPEWLLLDLKQATLIKRVKIVPHSGNGPREAELQMSNDGKAFTKVKGFTMDQNRPTEIDLPGTPVRYLRLYITSTYDPQSKTVGVVEFQPDEVPTLCSPFWWDIKSARTSFRVRPGYLVPIKETVESLLHPLPSDHYRAPLELKEIVDLTNRLDPNGILDWQVPEGQWTVLRTGYTLLPSRVNMGNPDGGRGLETDLLDAGAMDIHFRHVGTPLIEDAGALAGKTFQSAGIDSWEWFGGLPNWTAEFPALFKRYRGYDPLPYLPALARHSIGSAEMTDRFLYDYRRTIADCVADNYYGRLGELARSKGLMHHSEAGGPCTPDMMVMDALKNLGRCDFPYGEIGIDRRGSGLFIEKGQSQTGKQAASAGHIYGKKIVLAETYTSHGLLDSPASLKYTADTAFCEGFNRLLLFFLAFRDGEAMPGYSLGYLNLNRKVTWKNQVRPFADYMARCGFMLQQGLFVGDVLFYNGDGCPNFALYKHVDPSLGPGYDYDVCNTEVLLTRLSIKDGRIVLPDGMSYRLLVLPRRKTMPVEVAEKLRELVAAGMTLVGPKPQTAPGLKDYPRCDVRVQTIASEVWGDCDGEKVSEHAYGKGRVVCGKTIRDVLLADGVKPDFQYTAEQPGAFLDWIHRNANGSHIYFIFNRNDRTETADCTFRVTGKQPELWNPVTGETRDAAAFTQADGRTTLPLEFAPYESLFVVFRETTSKTTTQEKKNVASLQPIQELTGSWSVAFDPEWLYPKPAGEEGEKGSTLTFDKLVDWTQRAEDGIKFYSGKAVYRKTFDAPGLTAPSAGKLYLELGTVHDLAEVRLNGKTLGVVWTAPWRIEVTDTIKPVGNELEIGVVNLWPNRLIGDGPLPREQRRTETNRGTYYQGKHSLLPSGLLGPVTLQATEQLESRR